MKATSMILYLKQFSNAREFDELIGRVGVNSRKNIVGAEFDITILGRNSSLTMGNIAARVRRKSYVDNIRVNESNLV